MIFLSYARQDDDGLKPDSFVRRLHADLTAHGLTVWLDRVSMPSRGVPFLDEIKREIQSCSHVVLLVGPGALASAYVQEEWQYALSLCKPVTPALLVNDYGTLPRGLSKFDARAFWNPARYDEELATLVRQLQQGGAPVGAPVGVPELPRQFVAREDDLQALKDLALRHAREVGTAAITRFGVRGMPGVGKSTMAAALGRDCEVRYVFPDGVFWLPIGQSPSLLARQAQLAALLGQPFDSTIRDEPGGMARVSQLLADKACLLILDDVWTAEAVRAFDVLGPRCRLLFTTRTADVALSLGVPEHVLGVMSVEQGVAVLRSWSGRSDPGFQDIVQRVGSLPLALKLAGARLTEGMTASAWLETFHTVSQIKLGRRSSDPQENLQVSIELSVAWLGDEPDRLLYHGLGIFPPTGWIPEAVVVRLWRALQPGRSAFDCTELLVDLARLALIDRRSDDGAIALHNLLHRYALESLGEQVASTHAVLLDSYNLDQRPWHEVSDDGYLHEHLAHHLIGAKREASLATLFASDAWMNVRFRTTGYTYAGFLGDLAIAWRHASDEAVQQINRATEPVALATCVRYGLIRTSVHSLVSAYRPSFVVRAMEVGLWEPRRALTIVSMVQDPEARAKTYLALLETGHLAPELRALASGPVLDAIESMPTRKQSGGPLPQLELFQRLVPYLDGSGLERALSIAMGGRAGLDPWSAIEALIPALDPDRVSRLLAADLETTQANTDPASRAAHLRHLVPYLRGDARIGALDTWVEALQTIPDKEYIPEFGDFSPRLTEICDLAGELDGDHIGRVLDIVATSGAEAERARAIDKLAPRLTGDALTRPLDLTLAFRSEAARAQGLAALARRLDVAEITPVLAAALQLEEPLRKAEVLVAIATRDDTVIDRALEAVLALDRSVAGREVRAGQLAALAPSLGADRLTRVLTAVLESDDAVAVGEIVALLPSLRDEERSRALAYAVTIAARFEHEPDRSRGIVALAPYLEGALLARALDAASTLSDVEARARALATLAERLDGDSLTRVFDAALALQDEGAREKILRAALPRLATDQQERALAFVLSLPDGRERTVLFNALAPILEASLLPRALTAAMTFAASTYSFQDFRSWALDALAPRLDGALLGRALATMNVIPDLPARAAALAAIAPRTPNPARFVAELLDKDDIWSRPGVLRLLSDDQRHALLKRAEAIDDPGDRARALIALAQRCDDPLRTELLQRALETILRTSDTFDVADGLSRVIPLLSGEPLQRAMTRAIGLADELGDEDRWSYDEEWDLLKKWDRVLRLADISALLDDGRQARALEASCSLINAPFDPSPLLTPFAAVAQGALFERVLNAMLTIRSERARAAVVAAMAPRLDALALKTVLKAALNLKDAAASATALAALAPRLSGDELERALHAGHSIAEPAERARALAGFVPGAADAAPLRTEVGRALAERFTSDLIAGPRERLLSLLSDTTIFAPVISPQTFETIADHILDVCTRWRWQ